MSLKMRRPLRLILTVVILTLFFGSTFTSITFSPQKLRDYQRDWDEPDNADLLHFSNHSITGSGEGIPTFLNYNLTNNDSTTRTITDNVSINTNNNDIGFTNFTFSEIHVINATYLLELTNNAGFYNMFSNLANLTYYQQFFLPTNAYLNTISVYFQATIAIMANMSVYNATYNAALGRYVPDRKIDPNYWVAQDAQNNDGELALAHWETFNFTAKKTLLNISRTAQINDLGIFYVGVEVPTIFFTTVFVWYAAEDDFGFGINSGDAWRGITVSQTGFGDPTHPPQFFEELRSTNGKTVDFTVVMTVAPITNDPAPSDIGLRVDGTLVANTGGNSGSYMSYQLKQNTGQNCIYHISSAWSEYGYFVNSNVTFKLTQGYTIQQELSPDILYSVDTTLQKVTWNLTTTTAYPPEAIVNSTGIEFHLPGDWNVTRIVNITSGNYEVWQTGKPFWNTSVPEGTFNRTTIRNVSTGTWLLNTESPLYSFLVSVNSTFSGQSYFTNISDLLRLNGSVPAGPNGIPLLKRTDTEGIIASFLITRGQSLGSKSAMDASDNSYFTMVSDNSNNLCQSIIDLNFSLTDTSGILQHLLSELNVTIEQSTLNTSRDSEYSTGVWSELYANPQTLPNTHVQDEICDPLNVLIYTRYLSPIYFNFTADWLGNVQKDNITGVRLSVVHQLTEQYSDLKETMWAYNYTSSKWEEMDSTCLTTGDFQIGSIKYRKVVWDSALNSTVNVSAYINGTRNIQCMMNTTSQRDLTPGFATLQLDFINMEYTFKNPVASGNFTFSLFNQTSGIFDNSHILPINSRDCVTYVNFPNNVGDYYNVTSNNLQLRLNLTHWAPSVALAFLDHLYVTINYSQVQSLEWNQTILNINEVTTFTQSISTYDDAMANNITFTWDIDSTTFTPGNYSWIAVMSTGTQIAINTTSIWVKGLPTSILPDAGSGVMFENGNWVTQPNPYVNDTSKMIRVRVNDTVYGVNLTSITIETLPWSTGQLLVINEFATSGLEEKRGYYTIYLNTTGLAASTVGYNLTLNVTSSIYLSSWVNVTVRVDEIPSSLGVVQPTFTVWENETLDFGASFEDTFHHNLITGAVLSWHLLEDPTKQGTFTQILYVYETTIDTLNKNIAPRIEPYHLIINGTKTDFQNASIEAMLAVLAKNRTVLTADFSALQHNMLEGTVIGVSATLKYEGNNTAIPNVEVEFVFKLLSGTTQEEVKKKGLTDANGLASVDFLIPAGVTSISVSANYGGTESIARSEANPSGMFVIITPTQQLINTLIEYSPYIIAAIGAVIALSLYTRAQHKKSARFWDTRVSKLNDVLNIQHVLVIHKDSGTAILSQSMGTEKIDPNLISGFLTAMTSFQSEISVKKKDPTGKKGFILDYADFKILLEDGEFTRTALILEADASDTLKETLVRFIQRYESRYHKELAAWRGNLKELEGGENLIEEVFEISLIYPHVPNPSINTKKLPKLQKAIYEIARAITKERPYFFMSRLLEYAIAGRKEPKNQIWSVIYDMKRTHLLEPMTVANSSQ